jgi:hypothetical protein
MACLDPAPRPNSENASPEKPRRNLTQAFEALCHDEIALSPSAPQPMISPTGVADLITNAPMKPILPQFDLHPDLQRELSQALVNRVSFYSVIHDINKEALAMAENDSLVSKEDESESALVVAVNGESSCATTKRFDVDVAVIDEETWLLSTIATRSCEGRPVAACPPTFLQAMGEKEYENPVASLSNGSRTQLWKPSRSWWEAKSGKNPWIEPSSHNKRWR